MTYAIQLKCDGKKFFGYRNYKSEWTVAITAPEATTFKTEKGAWRAIQNGDKFVKLEYACSCWQDSLQRQGYDVDVVNIDQVSTEASVEAVEQLVAEPVIEAKTNSQKIPHAQPKLDLQSPVLYRIAPHGFFFSTKGDKLSLELAVCAILDKGFLNNSTHRIAEVWGFLINKEDKQNTLCVFRTHLLLAPIAFNQFSKINKFDFKKFKAEGEVHKEFSYYKIQPSVRNPENAFELQALESAREVYQSTDNFDEYYSKIDEAQKQPRTFGPGLVLCPTA